MTRSAGAPHAIGDSSESGADVFADAASSPPVCMRRGSVGCICRRHLLVLLSRTTFNGNVDHSNALGGTHASHV
jgi:hypothetical protein